MIRSIALFSFLFAVVLGAVSTISVQAASASERSQVTAQSVEACRGQFQKVANNGHNLNPSSIVDVYGNDLSLANAGDVAKAVKNGGIYILIVDKDGNPVVVDGVVQYFHCPN